MATASSGIPNIRILIVDDFEPWRRMVCSILEGQVDVKVVGEGADGWEEERQLRRVSAGLKRINAAVGPFGLATLHVSTVALKGGSADDDSAYSSIENQLSSYAAQRDALVAQILPLLEAAQFNGTPIPDATADSLIQQAKNLLSNVQAYAGSL